MKKRDASAPSRLLRLLSCATTLAAPDCARAFQVSSRALLPARLEPIPADEISRRLGLRPVPEGAGGAGGGGTMAMGGGPGTAYALTCEHEVVCPITGAHRGVLCRAALPRPSGGGSGVDHGAESIANDHDLVSQAILSGSLAASVRSRCADGSGVYHLPFVVTLVESLPAEGIEGLVRPGEAVFNSGGLETNEILVDLTGEDGEATERGGVMLYACNTHSDRDSASSDVYLLPPERSGKVWKFCIEYKVATINLRQIRSFGTRDSSTPLRPDVWLKDDCY